MWAVTDFHCKHYYKVVGDRGSKLLWAGSDLDLHCNCCYPIHHGQTQIFARGSQVTQYCMPPSASPGSKYLTSLSWLCFQQGVQGLVHPRPVAVRFWLELARQLLCVHCVLMPKKSSLKSFEIYLVIMYTLDVSYKQVFSCWGTKVM